jgi:hypothetical protein
MGWQMQQNAVDFLLHSLEIYGALYLFYIALWEWLKKEKLKSTAFTSFNVLQNKHNFR